tara:strand:+ start:196 stop:762 length:567 start_codon:yes stop_codon:yes gene_type:complete
MIRLLITFLGIVFLHSCSGNYQEKREQAAKMYGECDIPSENLKANKIKYKQCKAKERANGESLFNLAGDLNDLIDGKNSTVYQYSVNPYLWSASLEVTSNYPIKIADNQGGFIETDWISQSGNNSQRCLIKIRVLSTELTTSGVNTKFLCENKENDIWLSDKKEYFKEEKQITLKILEVAGKLADTNS